MRRLLRDTPHLGPSVSATLARLDVWVSSLETRTTERRLDRITVRSILSSASDAITLIAESLIENAEGEERDLLSKSLEEALLYCTGIDLELDYAQIESRLLKFLSSRGKFAFIKQFLSFCIFNFVWFQIGSSFRVTARTQAVFEKDMESVERICQRVVASTLRTYELRNHDLDPGAAERLILSIEEQLRGDSPETSAASDR